MTSLEGISGLADWLPQRLAEAAPQITVLGDVMLDGWFTGRIWCSVAEQWTGNTPAHQVE